VTTEQGISAGTRRIEAVAGEAALRRAQQDQGILDELESAAKAGRPALLDEYARLREQLKAAQREVERLKLKLATGGPAASIGDLIEVDGIKIWTPRFEGLDRKAHAAVVDDFRNRHRDSDFLLVSCAIDASGVSVNAASSPSLATRVGAPEILQRLGLRGGGRSDFAQGGGVAAGDVDDLRRKATNLLRRIVTEGSAQG
jgi:alanyl-tRNA synthetase